MTAATSYYHFDGLGSTSGLTDSSQNVTDTYIYNAYGEQVSPPGPTVNPFRFVGRLGYYYDTDTSDYYVREREYRPVIIRWLSEDPIEDDWSLYRYVGNNPVNVVDPTGLQPDNPPNNPCKCCNDAKKLDKNKKRIDCPRGGKYNACEINISCKANCGGGRLGYTAPPVDNAIEICIVCDLSKVNTQIAFDHERLHAVDFCCRLRGGFKTPGQCRDGEGKAYANTCNTQWGPATPLSRRCQSCGVFLSCSVDFPNDFKEPDPNKPCGPKDIFKKP